MNRINNWLIWLIYSRNFGFILIFSMALGSLILLQIFRQLYLTELLPVTVDYSRKCLVDFNAGKTQLVLFDQFNNCVGIDVQMNEANLDKKSSFKLLGLSFSSSLYWQYRSQINWSLDSFYEVSFFWGCSLSLEVYFTALHGILLSSSLLFGYVR